MSTAIGFIGGTLALGASIWLVVACEWKRRQLGMPFSSYWSDEDESR